MDRVQTPAGWADPGTGNVFDAASGNNLISTGFGANPINSSDANSGGNASGASSQNGLGGMDPAALQQALQNASNLSWSQLMGMVENLPSGQVPPAGTLTLPGMQNYSALTGLIPTGLPGAGGLDAAQQAVLGWLNDPNNGSAPTASMAQMLGFTKDPTTGKYMPLQSTQALTGYITDPNTGKQTPTTTTMGLGLQGINDILNANNNPANAFTYMSKLRGINNLGPAASFLRGGIVGATGTPLDVLQQQPTISNSDVMAQSMANLLNPNGTGQTTTSAPPGQVAYNPLSSSSPLGGDTLQALYASKPHNDALYQPNQPTQGMSSNDLVSHAMGLLYNSKPATQAPNTGGTPTGWGTSLQAYSKMAPTLQGALTNLVQAGGGEQPNDFLAGMQAAAPSFDKSAGGKVGAFGQF